MTERGSGGIGGTLGTAAAAGLLAISAATATTRADSARTDSAAAAAGSRAASARPSPADASALADEDLRQIRDQPGITGKVERFQLGHKPLSFLVGVIKKFTDDQAGKLAALVAYYGFFSLFPAMLAMVTILGFVLQGHEGLRKDIQDSALKNFPVIGDQISGDLGHALTGSTVALVIGLAGALWAGLGAMQAAQDAMNSVWDVPRADYPTFLAKRLRSLAALGLIGVLFGATAVVPQITGAFTSGPLAIVLLFVASAAVDAAAFLVAFRLLTVAKVTWRELVPGACVAGVAYLILLSAGTLYVKRSLNGAENTYGTFAVVIGLLSWIFLLAQVTLFAAEINVVRTRRLWPRTLFGKPVTRGDRRSVAAQAEAERVDDEMDVEVTFHDGPTKDAQQQERHDDEAAKRS